MSIQIDLSKIPLPKKFRRENAECYYDTYRKRLIQITPEETIRQKVAYYFENQLHVPTDSIWIEVPLSYYIKNTPGRADIVINKLLEDGQLIPMVVIECKQSMTPLTDRVTEQAIRYCDFLGSEYFVITNGYDFEIARYDESEQQYKWLERILNYEEMLNSVTMYMAEMEHYKRPTLQQLSNPAEFENLSVFGQSTPQYLRSFIVNLYYCLTDISHTLPKIKRANFELIEDLGIRFMDYSNAGGGHYIGDYRAFLVNDHNGNSQIVSFSLFGTDPDFRGENRNSYTSLVVAIDSYKVSHNILQYNMDKYTQPSSDGIVFLHNGQISSRPAQPLMDLVLHRSKNIRQEHSRILLGRIATNKLLYIDDFDVSETIYNFIEYALIREEYCKSTKMRHSL